MPDHLHALNNSELSVKQVAPKHLENPSIYAPLDKRLVQDDGVLWSKVPYGPHWDAAALHTLVGNIVRERLAFILQGVDDIRASTLITPEHRAE